MARKSNPQLRDAAEAGDLAGVRSALDAGADVHFGNDEPLRLAAEHGHLAVVTCLLAAGADLHAQRDYALRWAAEGGHLDVVACLLTAGADVHAEENLALVWAAESGHAPVVQLLREHGADHGYILDELHRYSPAVQVACLARGDLTGVSLTDLVGRGLCPDAICVLLERQGHAALARMLSATQMLASLTPDARAEMLGDMLVSASTELPHVKQG